jgi:hypothetical protein
MFRVSLFDHGELTSAVDLGSIVLGRGWTSYVYLTSDVATFLFWEGALIDYWSTDQGLSKQLKAMLRGIGARIVPSFMTDSLKRSVATGRSGCMHTGKYVLPSLR